MHKIRLIMLIPLAAAIWTPANDHLDPHLWAFPFVIWFQFFVLLLGMAATLIVFLVENRGSANA